MRLSQVDLNLFPVFDAIYTKRNLTRAAEQLCLTQPAVSNALARMRKTFNDQLFVSTPRGMVPTPVAENIHQRISDALHLLNSSVQESNTFVPEQSDKLFRLSMNDLSESLLLPQLINLLQREAPGIGVESYYTPRRDIAQALSSGSVDLAVDVPLVNDPQLLHQPLAGSRYVCLLRRGHPLAGKRLTLEDYLSLNHIHVSSRRQGTGLIDAELNKLGKQRYIQIRVQHAMIAPMMAMCTDLAFSGPEAMLQHYDAELLELPFELPDLAWHIYWHRSSDQDAANRWLRTRLMQLHTPGLQA